MDGVDHLSELTDEELRDRMSAFGLRAQSRDAMIAKLRQVHAQQCSHACDEEEEEVQDQDGERRPSDPTEVRRFLHWPL